MKLKTALLLVCGVAIVTVTVWINYANLNEAFGGGPPYYGRTTNMDKWSNPIPTLVVIDIIAILLVVILLRWGLRNVENK